MEDSSKYCMKLLALRDRLPCHFRMSEWHQHEINHKAMTFKLYTRYGLMKAMKVAGKDVEAASCHIDLMRN